jgi:hypothetical protein
MRGIDYAKEVTMLRTERWKTTRYSGYLVSQWGRVKSVKRGGERILRTHIDSEGEPFVSIYHGGDTQKVRVIYLVAEAFVPNPQRWLAVKRKNGIKTDTAADNLMWALSTEMPRHFATFTWSRFATKGVARL